MLLQDEHYYWVEQWEDQGWEPAQYHEGLGWLLIGEDVYRPDYVFFRIGDEIKPQQ